MLNLVLLIDDETLAGNLCKKLIEINGFAKKVHMLTNGREGINYFSDFFEQKRKGDHELLPPELIILDLQMSEMDGWKFLEEFVRKYSDRLSGTSVAILSNTVNPVDFVKAQEYKTVIEFVNKPLTINLLEELKVHPVLSPYFAE